MQTLHSVLLDDDILMLHVCCAFRKNSRVINIRCKLEINLNAKFEMIVGLRVCRSASRSVYVSAGGSVCRSVGASASRQVGVRACRPVGVRAYVPAGRSVCVCLPAARCPCVRACACRSHSVFDPPWGQVTLSVFGPTPHGNRTPPPLFVTCLEEEFFSYITS